MTEAARAFRKAPTNSESLLWQALKRGQIEGYKFRRQHPIGPFIADFFCPARKLIVEIDGPIHDTQQDRDNERQSLLETRGYHVLRVASASVEDDLQTVLTNIAEALHDNPL
jgi:very-short-patch-repair endonuclease